MLLGRTGAFGALSVLESASGVISFPDNLFMIFCFVLFFVENFAFILCLTVRCVKYFCFFLFKDRLLSAMLNAAMRCCDERVIPTRSGHDAGDVKSCIHRLTGDIMGI